MGAALSAAYVETMEEKGWPKRGTWTSFVVNLLIAAVFAGLLFVEHPAIQRFWFVNVAFAAISVVRAIRDLFAFSDRDAGE